MTDTQAGDMARTQSLYDRIADIHHLAMSLNGYQRSVANYLRKLDLNIGPDSLVLDAGSGTGVITLAAHEAGLSPKRIVDLDLSLNSLAVARKEVSEKTTGAGITEFAQSNVLQMPFADETFDLVLTCGVLEYTPIEKGLGEAARVLKAGCPLVFIPVRPSLVGSILEVLYDFKILPVDAIRAAAEKYFRIVTVDSFPPLEPIGWSKSVYLLEKL